MRVSINKGAGKINNIMKMKMIYLLNVDWNWIKQRPHFMAERLSEKNNVTIMYQHRYGRKGFQKRDAGSIYLKPIYVIPRGDCYKFLFKINQKIKKEVISKQINRTNADYIYLTFPDQVDTIPENFLGKIIYDCMDNHPAFVKKVGKRKLLEIQEGRLVKCATIILCSSEKLISVLIERYGAEIKNKIALVRNGYDGEMIEQFDEIMPVKNNYTIAYFGTISSWFNFDFVVKALEDFSNLTYLLIGPVVGITIPKSDRIKYIGTVEHKNLQSATRDANCLMMPFEVNEIIESVDPVKLYEYINFNKDILCSKYDEILRFDPFVHFYTDYDTFKEQIVLLMQRKEPKYTMKERLEFLNENSWEKRADTVEELIS